MTEPAETRAMSARRLLDLLDVLDFLAQDEPPGVLDPVEVLDAMQVGGGIPGWEWKGLAAVDALSIVEPDEHDTYTVRINSDSTFSVRRDHA